MEGVDNVEGVEKVDVALSLRGLSVAFGGVQAVRDVSFDIRRGEVMGLIGPNGAGKTTLINLVSGHERRDAGSIHLGDRDISRLPVHRRARLGLARSFQRTNIFPNLTVWQNTWLCAAAPRVGQYRVFVSRAKRAELTEVCERVLADAGLTDVADTVAVNLSHGQSRSLEVALLLASNGDVLLLDEPAAGMPMDGVQSVIETLSSIHQRSGVTMLIVEHKLPVVFGLCDRIAVLEQGALIALDTPERIAADPRVRDAYLGENIDV